MPYTTQIPFSREIIDVVMVDPDAPLPKVVRRTGSSGAKPVVDTAKEMQEKRQLAEREQITKVLASLQETARTMVQEQKKAFLDLERLAVRLAVAVAERFIHEKIAKGDFAIENLVRTAVANLNATQQVVVRLRPEDISLLEQRLGPNIPLIPGNADVRLEPDPTINRGDCRAESGEVAVYSQWQQQLGEIREQLERTVGHAHTRS